MYDKIQLNIATHTYLSKFVFTNLSTENLCLFMEMNLDIFEHLTWKTLHQNPKLIFYDKDLDYFYIKDYNKLNIILNQKMNRYVTTREIE